MKPELRDVFKLYREKIKSFGPDIEEVIDQKSGITYRHNKISFLRFDFRVNQFNAVFKEKKGYVDPKNLSRDIRKRKWGFEREVVITSKDNFDDVIYLLKQSYDTTI
jgi:predicted transport protein